MSNEPEESNIEAVALIKKLDPAPQRDPEAAANGKSRFLVEAQVYRASVSAQRQRRRKGWKENPMLRARIAIGFMIAVVICASSLLFIRPGGVQLSRSFGGMSAPNVQANAAVFVAGQNIPQGAVITQDMLSTISVPQDKVSAAEWTVAQKNQLVGKVAKFPLDAGTVITSAMVGNAATGMAAPQWVAPAHQAPPVANPQPTSGAPIPVEPGTGYSGQMVIKNADIRLLVKDTDGALEGVTQVVVDVRGYILSSQVSNQDYQGANYKYATLTIGVPVDQFESALRRLRSLGVRVLDENSSGQDVTSQFVDLQSQLTNLEATRDRIRSFLDQATTVDEALRVNQQLSDVQAQIEQIKGQMNYLSNRSAFSTITINLEPQLPKIAATPVPTATPTPVQGLGPWDAGKTTRQATDMLVSAYRLIANFLIWFFVVIVPVLGPPVVLVWLAVWFMRRRNRSASKGQQA